MPDGAPGGVTSGLLARLTPCQVGLCTVLLQHAEEGLVAAGLSEGRMLEILLREVESSMGPRQKSLLEVRKDLTKEAEGTALWEVMISRLREIDSPDALFDVFQGLGAAIARDFALPCALHATGIFGHFARRCVLAYKDASFEASVKLFDAVVEYVGAFLAITDSMDDTKPGQKEEPSGDRLALGTSQMEALAKSLMQDLPLSFGRVSFPVIDKALATLQDKLPLCHVVHFLRYVNSLQHRLADDAGSSLRSFHDGHQQRGLAEMRTASGWTLGLPSEGLPDLIQYASLALAGLHSEMRHLDDALQAIGESIRAAQEASDGGCLCACLYMLSLVLLHQGHTSKAFTMLRRCLHRAECLGLPMLQSFCCLGIARTLSVQPALSDRKKRGLLWKESISRMAGDVHVQPPVLRVQGAAGAGAAGATATAGPGAGGMAMAAMSGAGAGAGPGGLPRIFGHAGAGAAAVPATSRGGLTVLAAMLGQAPQEDVACRDALAHVTLASQLTTWAGPLGEGRPKVLLCQAEVARVFGLHPLTSTCCSMALDIYRNDLTAEDRAIALCQMAARQAEVSSSEAEPLLQGVARELPHASHLWAHIVGPCVIQALTRSGDTSSAAALLFQVAGTIRAVPHDLAASAAQQLRLAANGVRLYNGQLLAAYRSAREAVESRNGVPGDICSHLLCLTDVHLRAQDPVSALTPCLRCISAAESSRLLQFRGEALVRLARIKLEMRDLLGALQIAEEATPQLSACGSSRLRGEALMVQADVLFALLARQRQGCDMHRRLLREVDSILTRATAAFEAVAELNPLQRGHYLLARVLHELGDTAGRDRHAARFRWVSEYLSGHRSTWREVVNPSSSSSPSAPVAESPLAAPDTGQHGRKTGAALAELISLARRIERGGADSADPQIEVGKVVAQARGSAAAHGDVCSQRYPGVLGAGEGGAGRGLGNTGVLYPLAAALGA